MGQFRGGDRSWRLFVPAALLAAGCSKDASGPLPLQDFAPTDAVLLSTHSPNKDEDPSVLRARDGSVWVAWFSEQSGAAEIWLTQTANGRDWRQPVRVTVSSGGNFNPSLYQDDAGEFHLAWFRWTAPFHGHIHYNHSPSGSAWDSGAEEQVTTTADVDDWVPTLTQAPDGTLLVYFVSDARDAANPTNEIYVATKPPGAMTWTAAVPAAGINSPSAHDHLPFAARTGDQITLVWVRHDVSEPLPWLNPKSDVWAATSSDGLAWSAPAQVTQETGDIVNLFPAVYTNHAGTPTFVWLSTRLGAPRVFERPAASTAPYPEDVVENAALGGGYSHRIAPTPVANTELGVWVAGSGSALDVYYRVFRR